jgi:RNase P/RNase MRP subunit p29
MASDWDEHLAATLVGKHALVGLTYVDADGTVRRQIQIHGRITAVDETLVTMRLHGSEEEFTLPPILEAFEPAEPGEYRLRSTGEVVVDPDVLAKFRISAPATDPDD